TTVILTPDFSKELFNSSAVTNTVSLDFEGCRPILALVSTSLWSRATCTEAAFSEVMDRGETASLSEADLACNRTNWYLPSVGSTPSAALTASAAAILASLVPNAFV